MRSFVSLAMREQRCQESLIGKLRCTVLEENKGARMVQKVGQQVNEQFCDKN